MSSLNRNTLLSAQQPKPTLRRLRAKISVPYHRHRPPCRTSLYERSASRRGRSLHDKQQTQIHENPCLQRVSKPRSQKIRWLQNYEPVRSAIGIGNDWSPHRAVYQYFLTAGPWHQLYRPREVLLGFVI
jgi:hypothetical protein